MEQPSSPGRSPVDYRKCIEEALKFILESHINQTLELDLGLSKELCSFLLTHDVPLTAGNQLRKRTSNFFLLLLHLYFDSFSSSNGCDIRKKKRDFFLFPFGAFSDLKVWNLLFQLNACCKTNMRKKRKRIKQFSFLWVFNMNFNDLTEESTSSKSLFLINGSHKN